MSSLKLIHIDAHSSSRRAEKAFALSSRCQKTDLMPEVSYMYHVTNSLDSTYTSSFGKKNEAKKMKLQKLVLLIDFTES